MTRLPKPLARGLVTAGMVLAAFNLRPAVTSVGAVLRSLQADTGMSDTLAGVLTSMPVVAFALAGLVALRHGRRLQPGRALVAALALLTAGLSARVAAATTPVVFVGSWVALSGIAVGNLALPVAVKRWFADRVGWATGLYSMSLSLGTAAAAAATAPIATLAGSWRWGLAAWALPAAAATVVWVVVARRSAGASAPEPDLGPPAVPVHRHRQAWALAVFFGSQSLAAYTAMGWLPTIYQDAGVGSAEAGVYLAVVMLLGAPVSVILPPLAARYADQRAVVVVLVLFTASAYVGLLLAPATLPLLWALLLGVGFGAFPLALTMIALRASTTRGTSQLSSLTQGVGYLIAATGPVTVGAVHDRTGTWTAPLLLLLMLLLPQLLAGLSAARPGHVDAAA